MSRLLAKSPSSQSPRILVVDDHDAARNSMADVLTSVGYHVAGAASAPVALEKLSHEAYDIIITDLQMPGMNGLEFVQALRQCPHGAQIIMVTAHASVATAVAAMRHGAFDYLEKPFGLTQLEQVVERALAHGASWDQAPLAAAQATPVAPQLLGDSPAMCRLRERIAAVADTPATVLITGESGTGKELVARAIHSLSGRSAAPLISLNCPVLSAQLLESELFGHEKGAFTGADAPRVGRFELADQGTILLDEISEIELPVQAKLLRVLQERCFERVGASKTQTVDVRVLATSNRNLPAEIQAGRFREDLYYRLAVVPLELPPLRTRLADVPELAAHFLQAAAQRMQRSVVELTPDALRVLTEHAWPGNVRELENLMTRATVLCQGDAVRADDLRDWLISAPQNSREPRHALAEHPPAAVVPQAGMARPLTPSSCDPPRAIPAAPLSMHEMERQLIEETLERFEGHRAKTAAALGIGVRTLSGKLKLYGYTPRSKPPASAARASAA
ncbi:MAG: sigma-54 dependent transcriptional regulator [Pirellulales bacterium]|nr:sigma-54 dependent transcriptional regulator [Pirellulales bacterium]